MKNYIYETEGALGYHITSSKFPEPYTQRGLRSFHMRRKVRQRYGLSDTIFGLHGNVILMNHTHVHDFITRANSKRSEKQAFKIGEINAIGLIDELWHYIVALYARKEHRLWSRALDYVQKKVLPDDLKKLLIDFVEDFPPSSLLSGKKTSQEYLESRDNNESIMEIETEELLLVYLANNNPAFKPYLHLFEDVVLMKNPVYEELISLLKEFFSQLSPVDQSGETLYEALYSPIAHFPNDLSKQVAYIVDRFGLILTPLMNQRMIAALDLLREKHNAEENDQNETETAEQIEKNSLENQHSMTDAVMVWKNVFIWLYQLGKEYGMNIRTFAEIPDQEIARLAETGINTLWLTGIWERSYASQKIRKAMGLDDHYGSVNSLYDYQIARQLGGWAGLQNLKDRLHMRNIRLATSMIPSQVGIDSKMVIERPDLFLQRRLAPLATYTYKSDNLSTNTAVEIYLEDHHYKGDNEAVVFKRVQAVSGHTTYIYHGNDGSGPQPDTAQWDFCSSEAREMIINQIIETAKVFNILHMDDAHLLVKRHIQRLWFPLTEHKGIPSRNDYSISVKEFDALIPNEFWRDVSDRLAKEVPQAILLAQAPDMMEHIFVRSLGLHRVYNTAFMNMLRDEKNAQYRENMKKILASDPEFLSRLINFMSDADYDSVFTQFGKGDKYFGICVLMCTLPGLPIFAHGQIRGFSEKYDTQMTRPVQIESDDEEVMSRHRQEIFPLLHKRYRFAGINQWRLYDAHDKEGKPLENIFAYSNAIGLERSLVLFNNSGENASGYIRQSAPFQVTYSGQKETITQHLGEAISLHNEKRYFLLAREHHNGLWYLRECETLFKEGFHFDLKPYQYQVFWEIREIFDHDGLVQTLYEETESQGIEDFELALQELRLRPLYQSLQHILNPKGGSISKLLTLLYGQEDEVKIMASLHTDYEMTLIMLKALWRVDVKIQPYMQHAERHFKAFYNLLMLMVDEEFWQNLLSKRFAYGPFLSTWISIKILAYWRYIGIGPDNNQLTHLDLMNDWLLDRQMSYIWTYRGWGNYWSYDKYLRALVDTPIWDGKQPWRQYLESLFQIPEFRNACGINELSGTTWYHQEDFTTLMDLLFLILYYEKVAHTTRTSIDIIPRLQEGYEQIELASKISDFQLSHMLSTLSHDGPTSLSSRIKQSLLTSKKKTP